MAISFLKSVKLKHPSLFGVIRNLAFIVFYILAYWCLDAASFIYTYDKLNITPWNPPVAASVILLLTQRFRWSPLLFVAAFSFQVLFEHINAPLSILAATSACEMIVYTTAAWMIKEHFKISLQLQNLRDVIIFASTMTIAAGCMGLMYVLIYYAAGLISTPALLPSLIAEYWAGDALGLLIIVPIWFVTLPTITNALQARKFFSKAALYQYVLTGCLIVTVFALERMGFRIIYFLFIPVIWVATSNGLMGVIPILLQMQSGIALCSWAMTTDPNLTTKFLPFIMLVIVWTGLILGAVIDEREQIKTLNMKNNARLKAILDMAPDSMMIVDMQGVVVTVNKNFIQLYGATAADTIVGMSIQKIIPAFYPDLNGETFVLLKDGTDIPIEVSSAKVPVGDKFSSILTIRDITDRKRAETKIRHRRAVTEQASRINLTGSLAAVLAHELNQPLSAISSYASAGTFTLATAKDPLPKVTEQLAKITVQARRAGDIIRRLREFFQNSSLEIDNVNISQMVNEALMLIEDDIISAQVDVEVHISEPLHALIDRIQIEQVLINLIKNSLEALRETPKGRRRIRITGTLSMRNDIELVVTDTGPGISPDIIDQLFKPFVTTRLSGMGLGLTISRSIIEAHNGRLWAEAQSSSGASLHFTLPTQKAP